MADLMQQLRSHADQLEQRAGPVTWAEVAARTAPVVQPNRRWGWVVAGVSAAAVLVVVGLVSLGTLLGGDDVASSDIIEPVEEPSIVRTPYGEVPWWEISGSEAEVPGARVYQLMDSTWVSADQDGRSWTSTRGLRWSEASGDAGVIVNGDVLANGVRIVRSNEPTEPALRVSWDEGASYADYASPVSDLDPNLDWSNYAMSVAPVDDGVMVAWNASGTIPWNRIIGIQEPVLSFEVGSDGTVEVGTGAGEDVTNVTTVRIRVEGDNLIVTDLDGTELWRHMAAPGVLDARDDLPQEPDANAYRPYGSEFAVQIITTGGTRDVELPAEAAQILDAYPNGGTLALVNGTGLRLIASATPNTPERGPDLLGVWRWDGEGWALDTPAWLDSTVTVAYPLRVGSDALMQVFHQGESRVEWWLDFDRQKLDLPDEFAHGVVFDVDGGFIGSDADFDQPRFWFSTDGVEWGEITDPLAPRYPDMTGGGTRAVWAEGDRVFAISEPADGARSFRIADISALSGD